MRAIPQACVNSLDSKENPVGGIPGICQIVAFSNLTAPHDRQGFPNTKHEGRDFQAGNLPTEYPAQGNLILSRTLRKRIGSVKLPLFSDADIVPFRMTGPYQKERSRGFLSN